MYDLLQKTLKQEDFRFRGSKKTGCSVYERLQDFISKCLKKAVCHFLLKNSKSEKVPRKHLGNLVARCCSSSKVGQQNLAKTCREKRGRQNSGDVFFTLLLLTETKYDYWL